MALSNIFIRKIAWIPDLPWEKLLIYDTPSDESPYSPQSPADVPNEFGIFLYEDEERAEVLRITNSEEFKQYIANDVIRFQYFTPTMVKELAKFLGKIYGVEFLDPGDRQNYGPSLQKALEVAEKHGLRLGGYVVFPPRDDYRITVDTIIIPSSKKFREIQQITQELDFLHPPDAKYFTSRGDLALWWD